LDRYRERIPEFYIEVTGCGFRELDAKCDEFGGKLFTFEKEGKEQNEYVSKFCCSLTCRVIFRISIRTRNFCSSLNCLKDWRRDNKRHLSSSTPVSSIFSAAKSAVVIPRRKFRFASFFEHFEAVRFLLLANFSLSLHHLVCLNYYEFRDLQCEVKGIAAGRNIDIYDVFCCSHQMSQFSMNLTPF
jgi:hypothetical protein